MLNVAISENDTKKKDYLSKRINNSEDFHLIAVAENGFELIKLLNTCKLPPDIVFVNVHTPVIDGILTAIYLRLCLPMVKLYCTSKYTDDITIRQALTVSNGYLWNRFDRKEDKKELDNLLKSIHEVGFYLDKRLDRGKMMAQVMLATQKIAQNEAHIETLNLTNKEKQFLVLSATSLNCKEIANLLFTESNSLNVFQSRLCQKLDISTRQGVANYALQNGLAMLADFTGKE